MRVYTDEEKKLIDETEQEMLPLHKKACPECKGKGRLTAQQYYIDSTPKNGLARTTVDGMFVCRCGGTGRLIDNRDWIHSAVEREFKRAHAQVVLNGETFILDPRPDSTEKETRIAYWDHQGLNINLQKLWDLCRWIGMKCRGIQQPKKK